LMEKFDAKLKDGVVIEESSISGEKELSTSVGAGSAGAKKTSRIFFAKSWQEAVCSPDEYILDSAESKDVEIESSCRAGTCGTCSAKVLKGEVTYEEDYDALSDLEPGYVLTCCAKPVDSLVIDA